MILSLYFYFVSGRSRGLAGPRLLGDACVRLRIMSQLVRTSKDAHRDIGSHAQTFSKMLVALRR